MNVLAIGATGFIGKYVTRSLLEQGHRIAIVHRGRTTTDLSAEIQYMRGNRDALNDLLPAIARFRPTVVLDVIPYTERQARAVMNVSRGVAQRIVALSSADVYRNYDGFRGKATTPPDPVPLFEEAPLRETLYPYKGYGLPFDWADDYDKILVERVVMSDTELPGTILRLPAVYGPDDRHNRIGAYLDRLNAEGRVLMTKEQAEWRWTRGYVEDVAAAIILAVVDDRAAGRIYNVGEETAVTELEWIELIRNAVGWRGEVVLASVEDVPEHSRERFDFRYELITDTMRIRDELGYREVVGREDAVRRSAEWERLLRS
ncbi:MAG TPA: NAD-dependent epimerase/dehydratase family protein [Candidatus Paceibacterota bacterium]|nr:NAD-dependent epimerase/dehydratase family protein [Candidatus Paceibacterota bacterium]